jgi:sialate O-acetylesterase
MTKSSAIVRALLLSAAAATLLHAEVRVPKIISNHMLVQRGVPVRIWGTASAAEAVTVSMAGQSVKTQADATGRWEAFLAPIKAIGPHTLTIEGANKLTIEDVLAGEVWVGSGQSNMVFPVGMSIDGEKEAKEADFAQIRLFKVKNATSEYPLDDVEGEWTWCTPETVKGFSAVGYFFARHLREKVGAPVGIIQTAWGGTPAVSWTSRLTLASDPALAPSLVDYAKSIEDYPAAYARYQKQLKDWEAASAKARAEGQKVPNRPSAPVGPGHPWNPASLYNAMIAPLTPYAIRGVIWYQGENDAVVRRSYMYRRLFRTMIEDWRRAWGVGDFPFLFVQLANFAKAPQGQWPELREAQTMALGLANTGMAVTIDIGEPNDIHPKNKQDVGLRLGLAAQAIAYKQKVAYSGPLYRQLSREGNALRVWFDHTDGGLVAKGGELKNFEIAGANGKFVAAQARIDKNNVVVSSPEVADPVSVRYGWADSPECNLYNGEGLPASPFRTNRWIDPLLYR